MTVEKAERAPFLLPYIERGLIELNGANVRLSPAGLALPAKERLELEGLMALLLTASSTIH